METLKIEANIPLDSHPRHAPGITGYLWHPMKQQHGDIEYSNPAQLIET
jgi:hypothetical protein